MSKILCRFGENVWNFLGKSRENFKGDWGNITCRWGCQRKCWLVGHGQNFEGRG